MHYTDEQIEAYLENNMTSDNRIVFEKTMKSDTDLAYRVEAYRIIIESIRYTGFKDNLCNIEAQQKKKQPRKLTFAGRVAASVTIIIVASWIIDVLLVGSIFSDSASSGTMFNNTIPFNIVDELPEAPKDTTCLPLNE